jgi:hypothetical protein
MKRSNPAAQYQPFRAWQPLTFGGVARYAFDWIGRLFVTALIVSIIVTATVLFTVRRAWVPVLERAIAAAPAGAEIRSGHFTAPETLRIEDSPYLSIRFDPNGNLTARSTSEIEITFEPTQLRLHTLLGSKLFPYPPYWSLELNRAQLEPWWGAWKPAVFAYIAFGSVAQLFASWVALGILYSVPTRIAAAIARRQLTLWGAFKMSVAALMPGAIFLSIVIALYGLGQLRLVELAVSWALHFVFGWLFLVGAFLKLPKVGSANPFQPPPQAEPENDEEESEPAPAKTLFRRKKKK